MTRHGARRARAVLARRAHLARALAGHTPAGALSLGLDTARPRLGAARTAALLTVLERWAPAAAGRDLTAARRARAQLAGHRVPADLDAVLARCLAHADRGLGRGDDAEAALWLHEAFGLAFHHTRHMEERPSPLLADPAAFLAPLRASAAFRAVTEPSGATAAPRESPRESAHGGGSRRRRLVHQAPAAQEAAVDAPGDAPRHILAVTYGNWTFVADILAHYAHQSGVEVRTLDLAALPDPRLEPVLYDLLRARLARFRGAPARALPAGLRAELDRADVVFVEWAHRPAAWVSLLDGVDARVVVRLHSYEATTAEAQITDWSHVDDVVFVGEPTRRLTEAVVPGVSAARRVTIPNHADLARFTPDKDDGARHTLALIGWNLARKDPHWALDLLERLRAGDPRWRLHLIGAPPGPGAFAQRLSARLRGLGDAVHVVGRTEDVPGALRGVGWILSTSLRESAHLGLVEGAASGAVPVVRDWPHVARWGGARDLYPPEWTVHTVAEAAARIERTDWAPAGAAARAWVLAHLDWSVVRPQFDRLLLADPPPPGPAAPQPAAPQPAAPHPATSQPATSHPAAPQPAAPQPGEPSPATPHTPGRSA